MFQLLQPIWLFALAGLSIPVIIHLWNQQPGKTLRVGSIALVAENAVTYKKRVRLAEILLLLLRCALLACIALALAAPVWRRPAVSSSKGWVLMSRQQLTSTYQYFKPTIDSLLQAGLEFHYFEEGFKIEKLAVALQQPADSNTVQPSYRQLLALLNQQADAAMPLYLFTDSWLRNFSGPRTAVALNLHWYTYTPAPGNLPPGITDTSTLHITIFNHQYAGDVRYLTAALKAIQQFSGKKMVIQSTAAVNEIPAHPDWLFWLADEPAVGRDAENIVQYVKGRPSSNISWILPAGQDIFAPVDLYTAVIEKDTAAQKQQLLWKDGYGHSILTRQQENNTAYYWLYTHIDPKWNELAWSDNFPQLLFQLLYEKQSQSSAGNRLAVIDSTQLMPLLVPASEAVSKPAIFNETPLDNVFWLTAFLLFFAERLLSFHHRKITRNE